MQVLGTVDHKLIFAPLLAVSTGVALYTSYRLIKLNNEQEKDNVYESQKLLNEYLVFHYGSPMEVLKWDFGPKDALDFPKRCADLCLKHYTPKEDLPNRALDIGCAVGRSSFELAREFEEVVGIDFSQSFIDTCNQFKEDGWMNYSVPEEGDISVSLTATVSATIDRRRCLFQRGDACNLPLDLGNFGCVLAANLVCRLHTPMDFLNRLFNLVAPGGILVILAPYTWLEEYTQKSSWLGGYVGGNGNPVRGFDTLKQTLLPKFHLIEEVDMPFFIRETARKNQWSVSHATVWRRK